MAASSQEVGAQKPEVPLTYSAFKSFCDCRHLTITRIRLSVSLVETNIQVEFGDVRDAVSAPSCQKPRLFLIDKQSGTSVPTKPRHDSLRP